MYSSHFYFFKIIINFAKTEQVKQFKKIAWYFRESNLFTFNNFVIIYHFKNNVCVYRLVLNRLWVVIFCIYCIQQYSRYECKANHMSLKFASCQKFTFVVVFYQALPPVCTLNVITCIRVNFTPKRKKKPNSFWWHCHGLQSDESVQRCDIFTLSYSSLPRYIIQESNKRTFVCIDNLFSRKSTHWKYKRLAAPRWSRCLNVDRHCTLDNTEKNTPTHKVDRRRDLDVFTSTHNGDTNVGIYVMVLHKLISIAFEQFK